jgi:hypothetical protein
MANAVFRSRKALQSQTMWVLFGIVILIALIILLILIGRRAGVSLA